MTKGSLVKRMVAIALLAGAFVAVPAPSEATEPPYCYVQNGGSATRSPDWWLKGVGITNVWCTRPATNITIVMSVSRAPGSTVEAATVKQCSGTFCQAAVEFTDFPVFDRQCYETSSDVSASFPVVQGARGAFCSN